MRYLFFLSLLLVTCNKTTKHMDNYEVFGIDVSRHQQIINWDTIAQQQVSFAFVKATEGEEMVDTFFNKNWLNLKRVAIKRGAYHFFSPTAPVDKQIDLFTNTVKLQDGDLPPVLDFENTGNLNKKEISKKISAWLTGIEKHYETKPILYTNLKLYYKYIAGNITGYPIWIARYSYSKPHLFLGEDWLFWQYGNRGELRGVEGFVDFNVFNGTKSDLDSISVHIPKPLTYTSQKHIPLINHNQ